MFKYLILVITLAFPYTIFGEESASVISALIGLLFIFTRKKVNIPKDKNAIIMLCLLIVSFAVFIFKGHVASSLWNLFLIADFLIYYVVFSNLDFAKDKKAMLYKVLLYTSTVIALYSIIIQGVYYKVRVYGNIGYANTYALILLCVIIIQSKYEMKVIEKICNTVLITAFLFTGSRTTFLISVAILGVVFIKKYIIKNTEYQNLKYSYILLDCIYGFVSYIILDEFSFAGLIILPLIIGLLYCINSTVLRCKNRKRVLTINIVIIMLVVVSIGVLKVNSFQRIRNISFTNGTFQERLIMYEDGLKAIKNNLFGHGLSSYALGHSYEATAFYDVKYIHNSVLQYAYDIGVLGAIIFIYLAVSGIMICKDRIYRIIIYSTIFNSMLNFDFSYPVIVIIFTYMLFMGAYKKDKIYIISTKKIMLALILPIAASFIFAINEIIVSFSTYMINQESTASYTILKAWGQFWNHDERIYNNMARIDQQSYLDTKKTEYLDAGLICLKKSYSINNEDGRALWNIAYCYRKKNNYNNYINTMDKAYGYYKYSKEYYDQYIMDIKSIYSESRKLVYKDKIENIKSKERKAKYSLNHKAMYIKNQI